MVSPRSLIFIAAFLALFAGALMAISGAQTAGVNVNSRWSGSTASYNATQGGNITMLNLSMTSLTTRWAAYWGNVTGTIILGTATNNIYQWSVSASPIWARENLWSPHSISGWTYCCPACERMVLMTSILSWLSLYR